MTELNIARPAQRAAPPPRVTAWGYWVIFLKDVRIQIYLAGALIATVGSIALYGVNWMTPLIVVTGFPALAFIEYLIHRFFYHNQILYRFPATAGLWRLLHYAHHMEPGDTTDLIGPPLLAVPAMLLVTIPYGWLLDGPGGAGIAVAVGFAMLSLYEFCHGFSHIVTQPVSAYGKELRRLHMLHHFHNETGNFGVTSPIFDYIFGTYYADPSKVGRCPTVRNLGYTPEVAKRYPYVAAIEEKLQAQRNG